MTARVHGTVTVPGSVEEVFAVLSSEGWVERRAARFSDGARVVRREEQPGGGVLLAVSRELPDGAPGFLQKLLPKDGRVLQTDHWGPADASGARSGSWQVELPGAPARLGGSLRLEPAPGGVAYVREGEAKVSVPLVGGRAEAFVADMVSRLAAKEGALLTEALREDDGPPPVRPGRAGEPGPRPGAG